MLGLEPIDQFGNGGPGALVFDFTHRVTAPNCLSRLASARAAMVFQTSERCNEKARCGGLF
jgi:hypothetical protein